MKKHYLVTVLPNAKEPHKLYYPPEERKGEESRMITAASDIHALKRAVEIAKGRVYELRRNDSVEPRHPFPVYLEPLPSPTINIQKTKWTQK